MSDNDNPTADTEHALVEEYGLDTPDWETSWHGVPRPDEEFVCSVAEALERDDEIIINGRSRPLTVLGFEEHRSHGVVSGSDWPYHILWLRGNGTEYRLRWSHLCEYYPRLHTDSQLETTESYSVKHGEPRKWTRATDSGERVHWICPVDVGRDELLDWAIFRSLDGVNDCAVEAGRCQDE